MSERNIEKSRADRDTPDLTRLLNAAAAHYQAGRLGDAEAAYRSALAAVPGDATILHNLGAIAAAQGKHQDAIALLDDAIGQRPRYVSAHYNRALALLALGQTKAATEGLSRVCALAAGAL